MRVVRTNKLMAAAILRRSGMIAACGLLGALALPPFAQATRGMTVGFEDPAYISNDPAVRAKSLEQTVDSGAGIIRIPVYWRNIVGPVKPPDPTNPRSTSYDFSSIDDPVRDAEKHGLSVMLTVNVAPDWAEGPGRPSSAVPGTWRINPSDLADFTQAVAARYAGGFDPDGAGGPLPPLPAVQAIQIWNEPNTSGQITPQFDGTTPVGADIYRGMLNAAYPAVKLVNPKVQVVTGGTDPYGDPPGGPYPAPGVERIQPVQFWQRLLCVSPVKTKKTSKKKTAAKVRYVRTAGCPSPVRFDVLGHHPIDNTGAGPLASGPRPGDASTPDLGRVVSVLRGAESVGTTSGGRHPVWVTEFWWDSNPPNPSGAKLPVQARWIEQSLFLFWKAGANTAINFRFTDTSERPKVRAGLQSGVYFQDGRPKPSLTAVRFPFVTERINRQSLFAWGKAPQTGKLVIQRKQRGRWAPVKKLQVRKGAVFVTKLRLAGNQRLRALVGTNQSLVWKQAAAVPHKRRGGDGGPSTALIVLLTIAGVALLVFGVARIRRRQNRRNRHIRLAVG